MLADLASMKEELASSLEHARSSIDSFRAARENAGIDGFEDGCLRSSENETRSELDVLATEQQELLGSIKVINNALVDYDRQAARSLACGELSAADIEERNELLVRLLRQACVRSTENFKAQRALQKMLAEEGELLRCRRSEIEEAAVPVNKKALEVELALTKVRERMKAAQELIVEAAFSVPAVKAARDDMADALSRTHAELSLLEDELGRWYDKLESISGPSSAISYGAGADFSLDEAVFIEKWGSAIDAFYDDYSRIEGPVELQGYGRAIAASAYAHRIDPRLCAAVSIAESSGGKHCIRPCNAWGWGAADSNPYDLAAEWDSFDESIEAWHEGMATSRTGLADAPTLSSLASIYCSSPQWGATVADCMKQISQHLERAL